MTDNIVPFSGLKPLDISLGQVLSEAQGLLPGGAVVMGYADDGDLYFTSSIDDSATALWLMERCKKAMLAVE